MRARLRVLLAMAVAFSTIAFIGAPVGASDRFVDVPDSNIFHGDIGWLAEEGITRGCNPPVNDEYCPDDFVTRGQMAAFFVRSLGLTDTTGGTDFTDTDGSVFENDILLLSAAGITRGCNPPENDEFCPNDFVTREQMAAF
ncbi:MAG: S-layer homology domain-containing protein, partial [Acidimicrobiia bacterium]|nr:S-layer homology domain-containing protein [Acidimicrobiia bacterium]